MGRNTQRWAIIGFSATVLILVGAVASAGKHPSLVKPEKARCIVCHDDVVSEAHVHPPAADDCLNCHEFEKQESGLFVDLSADVPDLCLMCHDQLEGAATGEIEAPHAPVMDSCVNCHGSHSTKHAPLLTEDPDTLCWQCHDKKDVDGGHGIPVSRADCRSCHDVHGADNRGMLRGDVQHAPFAEGMCVSCHRKPRGTRVFLRAKGAELCYACHGDFPERLESGFIHDPVKKGECTGCHDPHMADHEKVLMMEDPDLCFSCHPRIEEKAGAEHPHAALEDGCLGCHDPHRSDNEYQLVEPVPEICLMCHDAEDPDLVAMHLEANLAETRCTGCHDPHGSTIDGMIWAESLHPPFVEDCATCHEGSASEVMEDGGSDLCLACHDDIGDVIAGAEVPHGAMEMAQCVDCHSPHASGQPSLLAAPAGRVCTTCHDDKAASVDSVSHAAIDWFGCRVCHEPHGGSKRQLLKQEGNELCEGCHLKRNVRELEDGSKELAGGLVLSGSRAEELVLIKLDDTKTLNHPIPGHPVTGLIEKNRRVELAKSLIGTQLACVSCHDPHVGASDQLLRYGARSSFELCSTCHLK